MTDASPNAVAAPDFAGLDSALHRADAEFGAAESHGVLCGLISVQGTGDLDRLLREVLGNAADPADLAVRESATRLDELRAYTLAQLAGGDLAFSPLLPQEDEPLARRSNQLGAWCRGYLYGLGLAGLPDPQQLSAEARELLSDLAEIGRSDFEVSEDEEDENAYAEILEYVRMGVILVHDELQPSQGPRTQH